MRAPNVPMVFALTAAGFDMHDENAIARRRYDAMLPRPVPPKRLSWPRAALNVFILIDLYTVFCLQRLTPRRPP